MKWSAPVVLLALTFAAPAFGQGSCVENCGDVNHNGAVFEINDLTYLIDYLLEDGPPPPCYDEAEWDYHQIVTINDALHLIQCLFACEFPPECPPALPPLDPAPDATNYLQARLCDLTVYPGQTSLTVPLYFYMTDYMYAVAYPVKFRVGEDIPTISLITWRPAADSLEFGPFFDSDDSGRARIAGLNLITSIPTNRLMPLADLRLDFTASAVARQLTIEWTSYPPVQDSQEVVTPMVMSGFWGAGIAKEPGLIIRYCVKRGDIDDDGAVTVSDLTKLIQCLFSECFLPCNESAIGDIDGSGNWNISDLTYLVAFLFQGGPAPAPC